MNVEAWLKQAAKKLEAAGIGTARLDALVLLGDELNIDRAQLLAEPERELKPEQIKRLRTQIKRRAGHEPLAYIRGKTEFYGREFYVDKRVLEPRPESETMIELLLMVFRARPCNGGGPCIIDVGTGSGALAVTAKLEIPDAQVFAVDIDEKCLAVARKNAKTFQTDIKFLQGDLLSPFQPKNYKLKTKNLFAILANLPYVPDNFQINPAATAEPRIAIFGGPDGLDLYRKLFEQLQNLEPKPELILTESLPPQHQKLAEIARRAGFRLEKTDDFIQLFRPAG